MRAGLHGQRLAGAGAAGEQAGSGAARLATSLATATAVSMPPRANSGPDGEPVDVVGEALERGRVGRQRSCPSSRPGSGRRRPGRWSRTRAWSAGAASGGRWCPRPVVGAGEPAPTARPAAGCRPGSPGLTPGCPGVPGCRGRRPVPGGPGAGRSRRRVAAGRARAHAARGCRAAGAVVAVREWRRRCRRAGRAPRASVRPRAVQVVLDRFHAVLTLAPPRRGWSRSGRVPRRRRPAPWP